jgi:hypothetical protein
MGSASSIHERRLSPETVEEHGDDYESKEEFKEEYIIPHEYEYIYSLHNIHSPTSKEEKDSEGECNSPVWIAINTIIKSVLIVRMDFQPKINDVMFEAMKKVIINMDSIYDIDYDAYCYGKIQRMDETKLMIVKQCLQNYYGGESLVIIRVESCHPVADLGKFMYDIFKFQRVGDYLYVYV